MSGDRGGAYPHFDAAMAAFQRGDDGEALKHCEALLSAVPTHRDGLILRGNLAIKADDVDAGIDAFSRLLDAHGLHAAVQRQLSRLLNRRAARRRKANESAAAREDCREALRADRDNVDAWYNLALCERDLGDETATARALSELLRRQPGDEDARLLAAQLLATRDTAAAVAQLGQLHRADLAPEALSIAVELDRAGDANATAAFGETLRLAAGKRPVPLLRAELGQALGLPAVVDSQEQLDHARQRFAHGLDELQARWDDDYLSRCERALEQLVWCNFKLAYQGRNDIELQGRYGDLLQRALCQWFPDGDQAPQPATKGPLRIGLLSSCWRNCTVGHYFGSWIDWLADAGHAVHLYQLGPTRDAHTERLAQRSSRFHFHDDGLASLAREIREDRLHLLIYPEIGMDARLLPLASLRLARRQAAAWGHPVTTGLPSIDAFFSCAEMEPENADAHYRERLLMLPELGVHYPLPDVEDGRSPALPDGPRVLLPHSLFKLHPDNDAVIAEVAAQCPEAGFLLFREHVGHWNDAIDRRLERAFRARGLATANRVHWLAATSRANYLAINRNADIMLDALHWSGGNTSLDALASGLPILTSRGRFMRGRQSAFMMERLGLPGWVVPAHQLGHMAAERLGDPDQIRQARTTITAHQDQLFSSDAARPDFLAHVERLARAH